MKDGSGYIKLFRSIRKWRYWPGKTGERFSRVEAFMDLIMSASHTNRTVGDVLILRGQVLTSIVRLARLWGWDRKTVRKFLKNLVKGAEIGTAKTNRHTIVTICNYDTYQANTVGPEVRGGQQKGQQSGQQKGQQTGHIETLSKHLEDIENQGPAAGSLSDDEVMEAYNRICLSFPKIRKIDVARSQLIKDSSNDIDDWEEFFTTVEASGDWLKSRNWKVNFKWLLNNRLEILEGNYLDKIQPQIDRSGDSVPR